MMGSTNGKARLAFKMGATLLLIAAAEVMIDGSDIGAVAGGFALAWLGALLLLRRPIVRDSAARIGAVAAALFALVLIDDPSLLSGVLFLVSMGLAIALPAHRYDDAAAWTLRLFRMTAGSVLLPLRDAAAMGAARNRQGQPRGVGSILTTLAVPLLGGAVFIALFADANPLIAGAFDRVALPDGPTVAWRSALALVLLIPIWASMRARPRAAAEGGARTAWIGSALSPGVATVSLSLLTFNVIFAVQNALDVTFLWSGAVLPAGVTMADYAHRGAYSLIVTALLAGLFVLVALSPGSPGAASVAVRRLVGLWIAQNLLLVASSILRTLDYVDAYGMTVLRLAALAWMALVAAGLALIGWRLTRDRSMRWLVNAMALAAAVVLTVASIVDLGASAAAWNVRVALAKGRSGPRLDLCYLAGLGSSSLVSLATLERHARDGSVRDRLAYLRGRAEVDVAEHQRHWRSWTWRDARRLAAVKRTAGSSPPPPTPAPFGRTCDGSIITSVAPPAARQHR